MVLSSSRRGWTRITGERAEGGREKRKEMNENRAKRGEAFRILRRNVNQACQEGERDRFDAGGGALASPLNNYKLLINDEGRS